MELVYCATAGGGEVRRVLRPGFGGRSATCNRGLRLIHRFAGLSFR